MEFHGVSWAPLCFVRFSISSFWIELIQMLKDLCELKFDALDLLLQFVITRV